MQSAFNLEFWEKPRNFLPAHVLRFNYGKESSPTKLSLDCYLQLEMPKSTQSAKSNYFEGNIITWYFWCTEGSACGIWRDRSILAVWKSLWFHLLQSPPHREHPSREKHRLEVFSILELLPHSNILSTLKPRFFPPPMAGSCRDIWEDNHILANHTLTQTTTVSAFQLGQFSHHSCESLKASCMFGKVQLCRHGSIKSSTEQRSLFKAELLAFVYL